MRYVALIRGINVGGHRKLPMSDLRGIFADRGYTNVVTYIQSGNVVFGSEGTDAAAMEQEIAQCIASTFSLDVQVMVRTPEELGAVAAGNPFLDRATQPSQLHVSFLSRAPTEEQLAVIDPKEFMPDEVAASGRALYLWCPNGIGRTTIPLARWERRWGMNITTRNWNTVTKLLDLATE